MKNLKIAFLQMNGIELDIEKNQMIADRYCREAAALGADIAVFPEMFSIAYPDGVADPRQHWKEVAFEGKQPDQALVAKYRSYAIGHDHPYLNHFRQLAATLNMAIAVTYMGRGKKAPRNSVLLIDRHGQDVIQYSKVHLYAPNFIDALCEPGEAFFVKELDTKAGPVKVGTLICADRDIPEPARILMKKGAELVLLCNASSIEGFSDGLISDFVRVRAYENAMAIAICNYPAPVEDGHSTLFNANGSIAFRAETEEGLFIAKCDLDALRQHRATTMSGDAFREECFFQEFLGGPILSPFKGRKNAMGEVPFQYTKGRDLQLHQIAGLKP